MLRSPGVLKACINGSTPSTILPRPRSASGKPMSWKLSSVKRQPVWQAAQLALVLKVTNPRFAASGIAVSSPSIQRSKGALPLTMVRSNVAMALPIVFSDTGSPGNAASNASR